ncbi:MAG: hypothetical protein FWE67_07025 [Planctomycetaceae bacterium]|nr:hypothetical protein [Planctomycetaceae bacterium]
MAQNMQLFFQGKGNIGTRSEHYKIISERFTRTAVERIITSFKKEKSKETELFGRKNEVNYVQCSRQHQGRELFC